MDYLFLTLLSITLIAFFSGVEIAFLSSNKFKIELDVTQNVLSAKILSRFVKSPSQFITSILIGVNIFTVIFGIYCTALITPGLINILPESLSGNLSLLLIQTIITTIFVLFAGEFIPKALFRLNPNQALSALSIPLLIFYFIAYPLVQIVLWLAHFLLKIFFNIEFNDDKPAFGRTDLDHFIDEVDHSLATKGELKDEIQMFQKALDFDRIKVRECMIPRNDLVAIDIDSSIEQLTQQFIDTGLSRILVYRDNIDNIIGFVHTIELFKKPESIQAVLLPLMIVPETMYARKLLSDFTQNRRSVAVVVDEHGLTSGIITVEDIIEEIFGEIDDEFDTEQLTEKDLGNNEYLFSGRLEVHYLNQKYGLELPESDEYLTLGGLVFHYHENIPQLRELVTLGNFQFYIISLKNNSIDMLRLIIRGQSDR
ncbi:MAG TPA: hemolysin family protein [Bacteroidia bacterium]|nr:hemolysin family protein [Bacteroidia bacterium]HNT79045.1 hemolysin family protein [Bacteroidia bacterium]